MRYGRRNRIRRTVIAAAALALIAGLTWASSAQAGDPCGPDGLDPNRDCCDQATLTLPDFPAMQLDSMRYFTWNRCSLARNKEVCVSLGAPTEGTGNCGTYVLPFTVRTCGQQAIALFSGDLNAVYMRTFFEEDLERSRTVQVWRFLLNGDLEVSDFLIQRFGNNPNIPQSYQDFGNQVYWAGYIDYRATCGKAAGEWEVEWVLNHDCDQFTHAKGSARPGTYYPDRSFCMASKDFVPIEGPFGDATVPLALTSEMRETRPFSTPNCKHPNPTSGSVVFGNAFCPCDPGEGRPLSYSDFEIHTESDCGAQLDTVKPGQVVKFLGFFADPTGGRGDEGFFRAVALVMGDAQWLADCDEAFDIGYYEGAFLISDPSRFRFTDPFGIGGKSDEIEGFFIDMVNAVDELGASIQGAPHDSDRMVSVNSVD